MAREARRSLVHVWGHACVLVAVALCRILNNNYLKKKLYMYIRMSVCNFVYSRDLAVRSAVVDNIRRRIVGVMFPPSIFEDRCVDFRRSMIDVSTFKDRYVALRRSCVAL